MSVRRLPAELGDTLEGVLRRVHTHDRVTGGIAGRPQCAESDRQVPFAEAQKAAGADHHGRGLAVLVE
jgi:hypothetical protein